MSIKILHTSDWHLGKSIYGHSLIEDQTYFIDNTLFPLLKKVSPDILIIAGDIFDKQIASISAINLFNRVITKIHTDFNIPICMISGNHDSPERISFASNILRKNNIYIGSNISDVYSAIEFNIKNKALSIYLLPYFNLQTAKSFLKNENISSIEEAYKNILATLKPKLNKEHFNILVTHAFVTGTKYDKSQSYLQVGGSEEVNSSVFNLFDYVALGHIHSHQKACNNLVYSGSPLHYSFDEPEKNKSLTLVEINENNYSIEEYEIVPLHKMRNISGTFNEIIEKGKTAPSDDYICATLDDDAPIYMPMEQLRVYFKNILTLNTGWIKSNTANTDTIEKSNIISRLSNPEYVFKEFIKRICKTDPTKSDMQVFNKATKLLKKDDNNETD